MSKIFAQIPNIKGEATGTNVADQIACTAMRQSVYLPVVRGDLRVEGDSVLGCLALTHVVDKASPKLRESALGGVNLSTVVITRQRTVGGSAQKVETITLTNAKVVRVDVETPVAAATLEPSETLVETFYLSAEKIKWEALVASGSTSTGNISGGWDTVEEKTI